MKLEERAVWYVEVVAYDKRHYKKQYECWNTVDQQDLAELAVGFLTNEGFGPRLAAWLSGIGGVHLATSLESTRGATMILETTGAEQLKRKNPGSIARARCV